MMMMMMMVMMMMMMMMMRMMRNDEDEDEDGDEDDDDDDDEKQGGDTDFDSDGSDGILMRVIVDINGLQVFWFTFVVRFNWSIFLNYDIFSDMFDHLHGISYCFNLVETWPPF